MSRRRQSTRSGPRAFGLNLLLGLVFLIVMLNVVIPWARDGLVKSAQDSFYPSLSPSASGETCGTLHTCQ